MIKWMMIQIDHSAPDGLFNWAYDIGMDRTWHVVGDALVHLGIFSETEGFGRRVEYKPLVNYPDVDSAINLKKDDFKNLFLAFLVLGSFYGYLPKFSFQGFTVEDTLGLIFEDLSKLDFCVFRDGYWFWNSPKLLTYVKDTSEYEYYIRPICVDCLDDIDPRDIEIMGQLKKSWQDFPIVWRLISIPNTCPWYY